jgi:type II protein arginine methyltransferase
VALELSADVPSAANVERWLGEPIKCLIVPISIFLTNKKGYPVLSKAHQDLVRTFARLNLQMVVQGSKRHDDMNFYVSYLEHLHKVLSSSSCLFLQILKCFPSERNH